MGVYGSVNLNDGTFYSLIFNVFDSETFVFYLQWLLEQKITEKRLVIILDNATPHKSERVKEFLEEHSEELDLIYLPKASPQLNPVEKVWKYMRYQVTHNEHSSQS